MNTSQPPFDPMSDFLFPRRQDRFDHVNDHSNVATEQGHYFSNLEAETASLQTFSLTEMAAIRKANQATLFEAGNTTVMRLLLRIKFLEGKVESLENTITALSLRSPVITTNSSTPSLPSSTLRARQAVLRGTGNIDIPARWQPRKYEYESISPTCPSTIPEHFWMETVWNHWKKTQVESGNKPPEKLTWLVNEEGVRVSTESFIRTSARMILTDFLSQTSYRRSVWKNVHQTGKEAMIGVMESLHPELKLCADHFKAQFFLQEQLNEVHKLWREEDGLERKFTRTKAEAVDAFSVPETPQPATQLSTLSHVDMDMPRRKPKRARVISTTSLSMDDVRSMPEDAETQPITMEEDLHWDAITRNSADSAEIVEDWSTLPKKTNNQVPDGETRKIVSRTTVAQTDYLTCNIPSIPLIPHALDVADLPTPPSPLPQRPTLVVPGLMDCSEMSEGSSLPSPSPPTMPSLAPSSRIEVTKTIRPGSILRQLEMRNEPKQMTTVTSPASFPLAAPLSMIPLQIPVPKSISKSTTGNATNSKSLTHPPMMPATSQDSRNKGQTAFIRHRERQWQTDNPDLPLPLIATFKAEYKLLSSKEKSNWNKLANQQQTPSTTSTFTPLTTAFPKPHSNPTPFQRPEA